MNTKSAKFPDEYWNKLIFFTWLKKMGFYETGDIIFRGDTMMINYYMANEIFKSFLEK